MMKLWRITRSQHASSAFSGTGAEKTGGRWNFKGFPMVYASENLSLAALEVFVHVPPGLIPDDMISISAVLPDSVSLLRLDASNLVATWREYPAPIELQQLGTEWLIEKKSLLMIAPSAINPMENNLLLNPMHPEIKRLRIATQQPFQFDPRMFGK